jgi:hypothetical protein
MSKKDDGSYVAPKFTPPPPRQPGPPTRVSIPDPRVHGSTKDPQSRR